VRKSSTLPRVRVRPELREQLEEVAEAGEMSLADVIRAACDEYITEHPGYTNVRVPIVGIINKSGIELYPHVAEQIEELGRAA